MRSFVNFDGSSPGNIISMGSPTAWVDLFLQDEMQIRKHPVNRQA